MESKEYISDAKRTESTNFSEIAQRISSEETIRMLHAAIGLVTEAGELQDALKKHIFYGKSLDKVNLKEEMGDLFWYLAILADTLGVEFEEIMESNIAKLKLRYGEKFDSARSQNRDLQGERRLLEEHH